MGLKAVKQVEMLAVVSASAEGELTAAQAFEKVFWPAYPRKTGKHMAKLEWERLGLRDDDQEALDQIMMALEWYKQNEWERGRSDWLRFVPHARTWLHQRRWVDLEG